ncbi:MAG TPA: TetR/AcrR family transcriptional regulator [Sphingomonas sp.]|uniref:TetR/AcrR family transcriptional regulator n=1 Tax=Sphingomonas sp. TaxID=28214 RepID=UPI002EDA163A
MRDRILAAAEARFRHYGFGKTTVGDVASDLGISTAYIYKFYSSKLAICEAIVAELVARVGGALDEVCDADIPASERLRRLFRVLLERSMALYFEDRKLHDMIRTSLDQQWPAIDRHKEGMRQAAQRIIEAGRASGEFETRTPLGDVVDAIWIALVPFAHPTVLEHLHAAHDLDRHARHIADLALRGLARN